MRSMTAREVATQKSLKNNLKHLINNYARNGALALLYLGSLMTLSLGPLASHALATGGPSIPSVPVQSSPADGDTLSDGNVTLTWDASTGINGTVFYNVEVGTTTPLSSPAYTTNTSSTSYAPGLLPANTYYWQVQACNDQSGQHCSTWSTLESFTVATADTDGPAIDGPSILPKSGSVFHGTSPQVSVKVTDPSGVSSVEVHLSRSAGNYHTSDVTLTDPDHDGVFTGNIDSTSVPSLTGYLLDFTAEDSLGNQSSLNRGVYSVDNEGPVVTPLAPPTPYSGSTLHGSSVPIGARVTDANAISSVTVQLTRSKGNVISPAFALTDPDHDGVYTGTLDSTTVGDGDGYLMKFVALDEFNNQGGLNRGVYSVDNAAPTVDITAPADGDYVRGTVTISGTVTDDNPDHYYLVVKDSHGNVVAGPGTVYAANVSDYSWDTTNVGDGTYTIDLEARDKAGNKDAASTQTISVTVDNTSPTASLNKPADGDYISGTKYKIRGTINDANIASYTVNVYSTSDPGHTSPVFSYSQPNAVNNKTFTLATISDTASIPDGTYDFVLVVTDKAGNSTTVSHQATIDNTGPQVSLNKPAAGDTISGDKVRVRATVNDTNFQSCVLNVYNAGTTTLVYTHTCPQTSSFKTETVATIDTTDGTFPDGSYDFVLTATDKAGNSSSDTNAGVIVDNTAPKVTVDTLTTNDTTPTVTGTVDDSSAILTVTVNGHTYSAHVDSTANGSGTYDWSADVTDTLSTGTYDVAATATDASGNTGQDSTTDELTIASTPVTIKGSSFTPNTSGNTSLLAGRGGDGAGATGGNDGSGSATGLGQTTGQVLGDSTTTPADTNGQVQGDQTTSLNANTDTTEKTAAKGCTKFLGICWYWWIPILAVIAILVYAYTRSDRNDATTSGR